MFQIDLFKDKDDCNVINDLIHLEYDHIKNILTSCISFKQDFKPNIEDYYYTSKYQTIKLFLGKNIGLSKVINDICGYFDLIIVLSENKKKLFNDCLGTVLTVSEALKLYFDDNDVTVKTVYIFEAYLTKEELHDIQRKFIKSNDQIMVELL